MNRYGKMLDEIQRVKSEGFDPSTETYMERMKGVNGGMSPEKKVQIKNALDSYLASGQAGDIRSGKVVRGDKMLLDKETWEKNKPYIERGKVNIDPSVVNDVQKVGDDYLIDRSNASKLSEGYFSTRTQAYDAIGDKGLKGSGSFAQSVRKQGEANLKYAIENVIPDEKLIEWGTTREELINEFVSGIE